MTLERRRLRRSIPFLDEIDHELFGEIKRIFVFGRDGDAAFFITKKDHVYAHGKNASGCLGLATNEPINEPRLIEGLTRRKVVEFAAGRCHVLALTKSGQVLACGSNEYGQLALSNCLETNQWKPVEALRKDRVIAIACGAFHSLALTSRGLILAWGFNFWGQLGLGHNQSKCQPTLVLALRKENIVEIACGQHHSVALSHKGNLYTWGHNAFGQLGIGRKCNFENIPSKVISHEEFSIKQVTCGQNHVLAVSTDGQMLGFGSNYYGQLGTGNRENQHRPVSVHLSECEPVKDVLSSPFSNTSLARTRSRNSLIFGKCGDNWLLTPIDNPAVEKPKRTNTQEAFAALNGATATTAVVKNKKYRWWHMLYYVREKFRKHF